MARHLREFQTADEAHAALERVRHAVKLLRAAALELKLAGAVKAHRRARAALKSTEGAVRHAERLYHEAYFAARRQEGTA